MIALQPVKARARMGRSGSFEKSKEGYRVFLPKPLPPSDPPLELSDRLLEDLSEADLALGRLDGAAAVLPEPDIFVYSYVRKEAVLSSQIEGTRSSLTDLFDLEAGTTDRGRPRDVREVANYVVALESSLGEVRQGRPVSLEMLRRAHSILVRGVRGDALEPGKFRSIQNWIGRHGDSPATAEYFPPPPDRMQKALTELELYIQVGGTEPALLRAGLAHAQFETIHPFVDGNGRIGRLLVTLMLVESRALERPVLYLSHYLLKHREEYVRSLQRTRTDGDWEGWLRFFLRGVQETAQQATGVARSILSLRDQHRGLAQRTLGSRASLATSLLDVLARSPVISIPAAAQALGVSFPTASTLMRELGEQGLVKEITGQRRNRFFRYEPYIAALESEAPVDG